MRCADCKNWIISEVVKYDDGTEIISRQSAVGNGQCQVLHIQTQEEFGCNSFVEGTEHNSISHKTGAPWHHFVMIPCPQCQGGEKCGGRCQCAGTGLVREYDDGYVGEELTRLHPKEKEILAKGTPKCRACGGDLKSDWVACPVCGERVYIPVAETEVIDGLGNAGEIPDAASAAQSARKDKAENMRVELDKQNGRMANPQ